MEDVAQFHGWCDRHGIQNFGIEVGIGPYGRGVLAACDISKGWHNFSRKNSPTLTLPRRALLSLSSFNALCLLLPPHL